MDEAKVIEFLEEVATLPVRDGLPRRPDWQMLTIKAKRLLEDAYAEKRKKLEEGR